MRKGSRKRCLAAAVLLAVLSGCGQGAAPQALTGGNSTKATTGAGIVDEGTVEHAANGADTGHDPSRPGVVDPEALRAFEDWRHTYHAAIHAHLRARAEAGDGRAQLALALLPLERTRKPTDPTALQRHRKARAAERAAAFARALEMMPDDPLVNWLAAFECGRGDPDCDRRAREARLQALEPDNAAVWLPELERAVAADDEAAIDAALERMLQASHQDVHLTDVGSLLAEQLAEVPTSPYPPQLAGVAGEFMGLGRPATTEDVKRSEALVVTYARPLPPFLGLSRACKPPLTAARADLCRGALMRVAGGSTLIERALGLTLQVRLTAGTPEGPAWRERLREYYWQYEMYQRHVTRGTPAAYYERMLREGEVAALEWLLAERDALHPPPGWLPADPRHRARVTTGREPDGP